MSRALELKERAALIAPPEAVAIEVSPRTRHYASEPRVLGVIRTVETDRLIWQRLRYSRRNASGELIRPTVGQYEAYGPVEDGYPLECSALSEYEDIKTGNGAAITADTTPIRAVFRGGFWILEMFGGGGASPIFPVTLTVASSVNGTDTLPARYTYNIADAVTGASLGTAVQICRADNGAPLAPHRWRRPAAGRMTSASFGIAYPTTVNGQPAVGVLWINEQLEQEACA